MSVDRSHGPQLSGSNLQRARDHNQRVTLHAIRVNGPVTRMALAQQTGLTSAAIANITNRLLKDRLILAAGRMLGGRGQPATKLVVNPDSCFSNSARSVSVSRSFHQRSSNSLCF